MADEFLYHAQKTRIKKQVCDVKGSKQDYFHRNNFILSLPSWTNFLRVQSLSLCSLANVSCMPNSSFCRWQQETWLLIYIVRESRLKKLYDLFVINFDTFKFSSFTCIWICESNNLYSGEMSDKLLYFLKEFRFLTSSLHSNSLFRGDHFNVVIIYRMSFVICPWHPPQKFRSRQVYSRLGLSTSTYISLAMCSMDHGCTLTKHLFGNLFAKSPFVRGEYDNVNGLRLNWFWTSSHVTWSGFHSHSHDPRRLTRSNCTSLLMNQRCHFSCFAQ